MRHCSCQLGMYIAILVSAAAVPAGPTWAQPEPKLVPDMWELDFAFRAPQTIRVTGAGEASGLYAYMTYTVTNRTGEEPLFLPEAEVVTDAGDRIAANRRIPPQVYRAIRQVERNPLLKDPIQVMGRILQGEDNARDGIIVWPVPEHNVREMQIFIAGLSGETRLVEDARTGEQHLLRKTLMLTYRTPGNLERRSGEPYVFSRQRWVLR